MVGAAGRAAGDRDLGGVGLERGGEVLGGLERRWRRDDQREELTGQPRDRRGLRQPQRALVGDDRADHHHAGDHQGVALPFPLIEELRQPDRAAGAADIGDLHALDRAGRAQHLLDRARGLVPAAARRRRHEHLEQVDRRPCVWACAASKVRSGDAATTGIAAALRRRSRRVSMAFPFQDTDDTGALGALARTLALA